MRKIAFTLFILCAAFLLGSAQTKSKKIDSKQTKQSKMKAIEITKDDFLKKVVDYQNNPGEWKYLGDKPAIIDFYASWCGPCKTIAPILDELAAEYNGKIYIYKVNTQKEEELAAIFGIKSIPTLLFIPMDENPQITQGALPKDALKQAIDSVLLKKQQE